MMRSHQSSADAGVPRDFGRSLARELDAMGIATREDGRDALERAKQASLTGIAFSGGGIRSATLNLGIVQALAELKLLRAFDYLSTVSGGGYIGSWLTALVHRQSSGDVKPIEEALATASPDGAPRPDPPAVRYLRDYSNYLTPRLGLFSGDTWSALATYLRNFDLNLATLVFTLAVPLLALRAVVPLVERLSLWAGQWLFAMAWIAVLIATAGVAVSLPSAAGRHAGSGARSRTIATAVAVLGILAAILLSCFVFFALRAREALYWPEWVGLGVALYLPQWIIGWAIYATRRMRNQAGAARSGFSAAKRARDALISVIAAAVAGAVAGLLLALFAQFTDWAVRPADPFWTEQAGGFVNPVGKWWAAGLGAGVMLFAVFCGTVVVHIGLVARVWTDADREWWARLGGWVTAFALGWSALCAVVMYAPVFFFWAREWLIAAGGASWVVATLVGVLVGRGRLGEVALGTPWRIWALRFAPYAFIAGALILLSYGVHLALLALDGRALPEFSEEVTWREAVLPTLMAVSVVPLAHVGIALAVTLAVALVLAWRVDVNVFSLYAFYRDRLIRCYLGASRATMGTRKANGFTGFDPADDLPLAEIRPGQRPFHIVNTAINLVRGRELAWQTRKAASFTFTPLDCGFALPPHGAGQALGQGCMGGYRPADEYMEGATLGGAVAISGASVSPSMGYRTSPGVAFLLTLFNVRLGRWCGNPCDSRAWKTFGPRIGARYLLSELLGLAGRDSPYVYLSDGGHFENLGIYELVRRRCRAIVAVDAGRDPRYEFADLANAIRKCYADFGALIEIDIAAIRPPEDARHSAAHHAVGTIRYPAHGAEPGFTGTLLYIKASLDGREPPDILSYSIEHATFPHETTADQFFDEPQFESYRKLGLHIGLAVLAPAVEQLRGLGRAPARETLAELLAPLAQHAPEEARSA